MSSAFIELLVSRLQTEGLHSNTRQGITFPAGPKTKLNQGENRGN